MLHRTLILSLSCLVSGSLYSIIKGPEVEPSHSIAGVLFAIHVMRNNGVPKDVTNIIEHISWQLRQQERNEWQPRITNLNSAIRVNRRDGGVISMVDVMSLSKHDKKMLQSLEPLLHMFLFDGPKIAALPVHIKNKFGSPIDEHFMLGS